MAGRSIRIGSGSAWWGDRIEPAGWNAERGRLDYLCFETMAEATVSAAQVRKRRDPSFPGFDTYLDDRFRRVLPGCLEHGTRIVSNQGWIDPEGAAARVVELLRELGQPGVRVAAVTGSLITERSLKIGGTLLEDGRPVSDLEAASSPLRPISAPSRSSKRSATAPGSSSPGGSPIRPCSSRR